MKAKKKKKKKEMGRDQHCCGETEREEGFPYSEKPSTVGGPAGTGRPFRGFERSPETGLWRAGQMRIYAHILCFSHVHPSLSCMSSGAEGNWGFKVEFGEWT